MTESKWTSHGKYVHFHVNKQIYKVQYAYAYVYYLDFGTNKNFKVSSIIGVNNFVFLLKLTKLYEFKMVSSILNHPVNGSIPIRM